jgi:hypothetical protein
MLKRLLSLGLLTVGGGLLSGCVSDTMWNTSRLKPLEKSPDYPGGSPVFANQTSARLPVEDTVARGQAHTDLPLYEGREHTPGRPLVTTFPYAITPKTLGRGKERFNIYCSPCHGRTGDANGMIVQRGFSAPPSYFLPRLRQAPVGHFYDVITNGYGVMYSFNDKVQPEDRWAIVAYIRVLQATRPIAAPKTLPAAVNSGTGATP